MLAGAPSHLRPLNILRDLPQVADLIELCFSPVMDSDGRRYLQEMRRDGHRSLGAWADRAMEASSMPLTGYVWEEDGKVIGNVSLIPFRHGRQRIYLIANIAVHPQYRRRHIAQALTERAVQHARDKKTDQIWLNVRDDNPGAIDLYKKLGFIERARRTQWQAATDPRPAVLQTDMTIMGRDPRNWPTQLNWLNRLYPDLLAWHRNWNIHYLRPGLWNWLYLLFIDVNIRQWAAVRGDSLQAILSWIPQGRGDGLFAAAGERSDPEALTLLLLHARKELFHTYSKLNLDYPAGEMEAAIRSAGFNPLRTIIWMQATR